MLGVTGVTQNNAKLLRMGDGGDSSDGVAGSTTRRPARDPDGEHLQVVVAVLTYRRPDDLAELLPRLRAQLPDARPGTATILVVDNDPAASARAIVGAGATGSDGTESRGTESRGTSPGTPLRYVHEPRPGIAAARNRALDEARAADVLVFLDDDERPGPGWLRHLLDTYERTGAAGVVGPVVSRFAVPLDPWVEAGRFFDRRRLPTGTPVRVAATNNLLLDLFLVHRSGIRFDERFGLSGGSDTLFTRALVATGLELVWCDEAVVTDVVPAERGRAEWVLNRARRSGNSWSRTTLALTPGPGPQMLARARLSAAGGVRIGAGAARVLVGRATGRRSWQARGARTLERGRGLLGGAWGRVEVEYARSHLTDRT